MDGSPIGYILPMKRVFFFRHAKSSWGNAALNDHERPLNRRGESDAPEMGARLAVKGMTPDRIVSSSALRARSTASLVARALGLVEEAVQIDSRLYLASLSEMLEVIHEQPDDLNSIMLFAHNPGMTFAANRLGGYDIDNLPTCGVFGLQFETEMWAEVGFASTTQLFLDYPKNR